MGRNKKKSNVATAADSDSENEQQDQEAPPTTTTVTTEVDSEPSSTTTAATSYVEVFKTDKKKPSVMIKGLTARGLKLPAVASVLKRMVGPVEVIKGEDALEVAGDVVALVKSTLASKFDIPEHLIVQDAAAAAASPPVAPTAPSAAAAAGDKKTKKDTAADSGSEEGSDEESEEDDMIVQRHGGVQVAYCPACTFPAEMCEYSGMLEACKPWLLTQLDDDAEVERLANAADKGRKRRVLTEAEKLEALLSGKGGGKKVEQEIVLESKVRVGRKKTTMIYGLQLFGVNLAEAAAQLKKQFACSVNVATGAGTQDHLDVQGDVILQLLEVLPSKYKIPTTAIFIKDGDGKNPAF